MLRAAQQEVELMLGTPSSVSRRACGISAWERRHVSDDEDSSNIDIVTPLKRIGGGANEAKGTGKPPIGETPLTRMVRESR